MGQTVVEKIAQAHWPTGRRTGRLRAGDFLSVRPRPRHDPRQHRGGDEQVPGDRRGAGHTIRSSRSSPWTTTSRTAVRGEPGQVPRHRGVRRASRASTSTRPAPASATRSWSSSSTSCPASFVVGLRLPLQHVRRHGRPGHAGGAHRRRGDLGHRHVLVADPAHGAGGPRRAAAGRASPARTSSSPCAACTTRARC